MTDPGDTNSAELPIAELPDTPVRNTLDAPTRQLVAGWLADRANCLDGQRTAGPTDLELAHFAGDRDAWARRISAAIAMLRRDSCLIGEDELPFQTAVSVRDWLTDVQHHALKGAAAALHEAIHAVRGEREAAVEALAQRNKEQYGYHVKFIHGRGEPLAIPRIACTEGLVESARHPELVTVGLPIPLAHGLLTRLADDILNGGRTLAAGQDLGGLLSVGRALQILVADERGVFPGEDGVDPECSRWQAFPDHPC